MPATVQLPALLRLVRQFEFPHKLGICERLFGPTISRMGVCWVDTAAHVVWKLDLASSTHRWIVYGDYQGSAFLEWARRTLPRDGVVVDSGANIGQMLLYLAQYVPDGKVLAFEPGREAADWLAGCLSLQDWTNVDLLRCGLGESNESLFLETKGGPEWHGACNQVSSTTGDPIEIVRLDDFTARRNIARVDLWKLDMEGYELHALRGAESLLTQHAIGAIYAELGYGNGQRIVDYLATFGYECRLFDQRGRLYRAAELPDHTNGLFLPIA
jgi:FkbM family methyltransferase